MRNNGAGISNGTHYRNSSGDRNSVRGGVSSPHLVSRLREVEELERSSWCRVWLPACRCL